MVKKGKRKSINFIPAYFKSIEGEGNLKKIEDYWFHWSYGREKKKKNTLK